MSAPSSPAEWFHAVRCQSPRLTEEPWSTEAEWALQAWLWHATEALAERIEHGNTGLFRMRRLLADHARAEFLR